jgi:short-subunit dehydrogenase
VTRVHAPHARALVTGASSGIGRALAVSLGRRGAAVVLVARRREALEAAAAEVRAAGAEARVLVLDVADTRATVAAVRAADTEAPIDLVVAAAGAGARAGAAPHGWEALEEAAHTNFCGAACTLTALAERMAERGSGHLVGVSSIAALGALPAAAAYCAPKAGLSMLLECLRLDLAPAGVAVTAVHAGFVDTPMVAARAGAMPGLVTAPEAAERIVHALARRPARIDFPLPLALAARAAAHLPGPLRDRILRRL